MHDAAHPAQRQIDDVPEQHDQDRQQVLGDRGFMLPTGPGRGAASSDA